MSALPKIDYWTAKEYLALERKVEDRSEYLTPIQTLNPRSCPPTRA
jgi:hypothetical protein